MTLAQRINGSLRRVPTWPGYVLGVIPAAWLWYLGLTGGLGPEPVKALEHELGKIALQLLVASLCVSPILWVARVNLIRFRRMIGLLAFFYVVMHFAVYLFLDLRLNWAQIGEDLTKRPYIILGAISLLALIPVALTSNDRSVRRLGSALWGRIHWLVYPASIGAAAHYLWLVKAWPLEPILYLAIMVGLVAWRPLRKAARTRQRQVA
ncbi:protein-methionine-sulfoxide reductase heme-binding subunit MsrQ [Halovulum dunhuangense]|uniref:Protein-methionine-sulfoxide reductase heme-binding subunit MsrQ n=1 Tax=Halovulum dunhuangense TaxID=1505036 RepID=A0A849KXZ7_9RHOB|nr:protein-methionine-sulfoxide reductase heme-binding subunit MsrQ [Halovulum dunhuangense]NNU78806.1 protein-methionine-sulfoxide reductase heme-binding subunit MsrQ [Halovulum dunhuangense]